ncbi:MAG: aldehyde dehydrogenase family protein [Actinomycetota bacterium]
MTVVTPLLDADLPTGMLTAAGFAQPNEDLEVRSPFSGELVARVALAGAADAAAAVRAAAGHLPPPPVAERAAVLDRAAVLVAERAGVLARVIALEAGKPVAQARGEVARCVDTLTFAAAAARTLGGEVVPMEASAAGRGKVAFVVREPVGVVAGISPFNFPLNLVAHKVAPAIAAGCPVVVKPAEATPLSALALGGILLEAGLPPGYLTVLPGPGGVVGQALVDDPDVALVSFTGSPEVGWGIRRRAPRKTVALELGNSTPVIVAADADLDDAARRIARSGFTHAGQSCISVQRVYAAREVHDEFLALLSDRVAELVVGDPLDEATDVGPLIDVAARDRVVAWIDEACEAGARVEAGGDVIDGLLRPTVVSGITPDMSLSCREVFGPVVGVAAYRSVDEAVDLANSTPYGLQAGVFTARVDRALAWSRRLRFGGVVVNETPTFRADQQPYGGVKDSGNTREGPAYAVRTMTEEKLVILRLPED